MPATADPRRVLVTSSHSVLGVAVVRALVSDGLDVTTVTRAVRHGDVVWDPAAGRLAADALPAHGAVVHVEGSCLPWYRPRSRARAAAHRSAVDGTALLVDALRANPPATFVLVTTAAYYGDNGAEPVTEHAPPGASSLAAVAVRREAAVAPLADLGARVVRLRVAWLLHPGVHPLRHQLPLLRAGLVGPVGSGHQLWSWVTVDDVVRAIRRALDDDTLRGPVNVAAPGAVPAAAFVGALAERVGRRPGLKLPGSAVWVFGRELACSMLLPSVRVMPRALLDAGHEFTHPRLEVALDAVL